MSEGIVEVIVGRRRRRHWAVEEKLQIVAETNEPGAWIGDVAARHDLYPGLLFAWRRQVRKGTLTERHAPLFLPVETASAPDLLQQPELVEPETTRRIEIELADGCRIRIDEGVGLASLRHVLAIARMIAPPPGVRIWLAAGVTEMRKGFDGLAMLVQQQLGKDPPALRLSRAPRPTVDIQHTVCEWPGSPILGIRCSGERFGSHLIGAART